jgi:hypothetical protein
LGIVKEQNLNNSHMIPPDAERLFAKQMNGTTLSINSSHASLVSHPDEIAQLILNATKGNSTQTPGRAT